VNGEVLPALGSLLETTFAGLVPEMSERRLHQPPGQAVIG